MTNKEEVKKLISDCESLIKRSRKKQYQYFLLSLIFLSLGIWFKTSESSILLNSSPIWLVLSLSPISFSIAMQYQIEKLRRLINEVKRRKMI